jgi:3',5'-cyclic AMP phosphodiesterase CpdA
MSLIILVILGVGLLQAYKAFSGYDPMKLDATSLQGLMTSDSVYQTLIGLLTFDPKESIVGIVDKGEMGDMGDKGVKSNSPAKFKFAVMADSHKDTANLQMALAKAKNAGVKFVIMMGDLSDIGTVEELTATKQVLDNSGLQYYTAAGDHDLWDSRDKENDAPKNFKQVFGQTYKSFSYDNVRYILIYNSDNYLGLDGVQLKWIEDELAAIPETTQLTFVFAPTPLYHPSSDHVMGKVTPKLASQADHLNTIFKGAGVELVLSADTHFYSSFTEPKNDLKMMTVGAVTSERNPQAPRFAMVDILEDGGYNIEEVEVK